jgi:hypothetical protein
MKFNIKHLDLVRVVQTLYRHALPVGLGIGENIASGIKKLPIEEVETLLLNGTRVYPGRKNITVITIDYVHGVPLKFEYVIQTGITYATDYDVRNGKYMFLEALIDEFGSKNIIIVRKSYESGHEFADRAERKKEIKEWQQIIRSNFWDNILPKN